MKIKIPYRNLAAAVVFLIFCAIPCLGFAESSNFSMSDGLTGMSGDLGGGMVGHTFSNGVTGLSTDLGNGVTAHSFSDGTTGMSETFGDTTYHRFSNGKSGVTHDMGGGMKRHVFSDGTSGVSVDLAPKITTFEDELKKLQGFGNAIPAEESEEEEAGE